MKIPKIIILLLIIFILGFVFYLLWTPFKSQNSNLFNFTKEGSRNWSAIMTSCKTANTTHFYPWCYVRCNELNTIEGQACKIKGKIIGIRDGFKVVNLVCPKKGNSFILDSAGCSELFIN